MDPRLRTYALCSTCSYSVGEIKALLLPLEVYKQNCTLSWYFIIKVMIVNRKLRVAQKLILIFYNNLISEKYLV
jgi:hypothetical protein